MPNKLPYRPVCLLLLLSLLFSVLPSWAALPGDLNGDGVLNVADLTRLQAIIDGEVDWRPEADLNFDGQIDERDRLLLEEALQGRSLPTLLSKATFDQDGGILAHPETGFQLTIPANSLTEPQQVVLTKISKDLLQASGVTTEDDTTAFRIFGLPAADNLEFTFRLPTTRAGEAEQFSLALGEYVLPRNAELPDWHFQLLNQPEDGISRQNGQLIWKPNLMPAAEEATRSGGAQNAPDDVVVDILRDWLGGTYYESQHFRLQPITSTTAETEIAQMEALLRDLENAFQVAIGMNFPENKRIDKWGSSAEKIKAVIKVPDKAKFYGLIGSNESAEDAWCNPPGVWTPPFLEFNTGVLTSKDRREIASHEFFHYLQYYYASNTTTIWLDEMSATWMEGRVSAQGDNYCPSTYKNFRAPINGLYRSSSRFNMNHAGPHGYSISAFAYYLSKRYDWRDSFWHDVFSHQQYASGYGVEPLRHAAANMHVGGLSFLYLTFLRNYLSDGVSDAPSGKAAFGKGGMNAVMMFRDQDQDEETWKKYPDNGKITKVTKLEDLSGKLEQKFKVQSLGAATWRFDFPNPSEVLSDGVIARVEVDDTCTDLFAVLFKSAKCIGISKMESVTHNEDKKIRALSLNLRSLAESKEPMFLGLVAVNADSYAGDSSQLQEVNMSVQFLGKINLEPETTYFDLYGHRLLEATADLELTCVDKEDAFGAYTVQYWGPAVTDSNVISRYRLVYVNLLQSWPLTVRLQTTITPVDLGPLAGEDPWGNEFTASAVPTDKAVIYVDKRLASASDFYSSQEFEVPLAQLASPEGWQMLLNANNPTDAIHITVRPIYIGSGTATGLGRNLNCYTIMLNPR